MLRTLRWFGVWHGKENLVQLSLLWLYTRVCTTLLRLTLQKTRRLLLTQGFDKALCGGLLAEIQRMQRKESKWRCFFQF